MDNLDTDVGAESEDELEQLQRALPSPKTWLARIKRDKKECERWFKSARLAVEIYESAEAADMGEVKPTFNILHSNIETTVPALYNSTPIPDVRRRFGDVDQIGKEAVDVVERSLSYLVDAYYFDGAVTEAVRDGELAGRGTVRLRYDPEIQGGTVAYQTVWTEHVSWDKWGYGPATCWEKVPWVWFELDLTTEELRELGVGEEKIKTLGLHENDPDERSKDTDSQTPPTGTLKTIRAWEIWDKRTRAVVYVTDEDSSYLGEPRPDPLQLEQFFPVPKPLMPLRQRRGFVPLCPYDVYRPLVVELDRITQRINALIAQLRVRGIYDSRLKGMFELLRDCADGEYIAADDATQFATGAGGLDKSIAHWPMAEIVGALQQLYVQREQTKQTIYEVTGLSDVLRGATNPNETLGAQQLKAQVGSQRLSKRQNSVADFCRDVFRMMTEILCNHFTPEMLSMMTGIQVQPQTMELLRNDMTRGYRIDIETDSTIRADVARSQEQMSLFLQGTAQYAQSMAAVLQLEPGAKAPIVQIYAAFARQFKLGKSAEDALEQMIEAAGQPEEPKPSPEAEKIKLDQQRMEMQAQMDQQKQQADMAKMQAELEMKRELAEIDKAMKMMDVDLAQQKAKIELEKMHMELSLKRQSMELDQEAKVFDIRSKQELSAVDIDARRQRAEQESDARKAKAEAAD
jgi:hypothetical protein